MIEFGTAPWDAFLAEARPLFAANWAETGGEGEFVLDGDGYDALDDVNRLLCCTVRDDGVLVGYCVIVQGADRHRGGSVVAVVDVVYISPTWRKGLLAMRFLRYVDNLLRELGVPEVLHQASVKRDLGPLLERMGYTAVTTMYSRRL